MSNKENRQLAAIMFTDIVGYTALMSQNEKRALEVLEVNRSVLKELLSKHNGRLLKEIGDGTLSSFTSSIDAVQCARDFQLAIAEEGFGLRIGIHVGEVTYTENDVFGDGVNIASRIEPLAPSGGVFISDRVNEDLRNKPELPTVYVGERHLKNVGRPVKIFCLSGQGLSIPQKSVSNSLSEMIANLWERRLVQIMTIYLLVAYFFIQLAEWTSAKFMLSPYWAEFSGILLVSLVPSVAIIAFYHGNSGPDRWVPAEKIVIPTNVLLSAVLLFFLFQGRDLGATAKSVTLQDENGRDIEKVVASQSFRKKVAIFNFQDRSKNSAYAWLSLGIPSTLGASLEQDIYIDSRGPDYFKESLQHNRLSPENAPASWMREAAEQYRFEYFLTGSYDLLEGELTITSQLYRTSNGKIISSSTFNGDLFDQIDELVAGLQQDLGFSQAQVKKASILPVRSVFTSSQEAAKAFSQGQKFIDWDNDYEAGIHALEEAIAFDSLFAHAHFALMVHNVNSGRMEQGMAHMEKTMDYLYMLPGRTQLQAKSLNYFLMGESSKRIKVLKMWQEIYPQDLTPYRNLSYIYFNSGHLDSAQVVLQEALKLEDDRGNLTIEMAHVLLAKKDYQGAEKYYQKYADKFPNQSRSSRLLGGFYLDQGKFQKAQSNFERATFLDDDDYKAKVQLALIMERRGELSEAEKEYNKLISRSRTAEDSILVLNKFSQYYFNRGQINRAIELQNVSFKASEKTLPPIQLALNRITNLKGYFLIGRADEALEIIKESKNAFESPWEDLWRFGVIDYHVFRKDIESVEEDIEIIREWTAKYGSTGGLELICRAELEFLRTEYDKAAKLLQELQENNRGNISDDRVINLLARSLQLSGDLTGAKQALDQFLVKNPYHAESNFNQSKVLSELGMPDQAQEHLSRAKMIWENADPEYTLLQEALAVGLP